MARNFHKRERPSAISEINVTPLIDLAFALLIIFMITTPLLEQTIALELPTERPRPAAPSEQPFRTVSVDADGQYYWEGEPIEADELDALFQSIATETPVPAIRIRGDRRARYGQVIAIIDAMKQNGLRDVSLDTAVE